MRRFMLLSYQIDKLAPTYGDTPRLEVSVYKSISNGDSCNMCTIKTTNHMGTHVDGPRHFDQDGREISDYSLEELTFDSPLLMDIRKKEGELIEEEDLAKFGDLDAHDCLIIRTGFGELRNKDVYFRNNPGISLEAMHYIRKKLKNVKSIIIDSISISSFSNRELGREVHKAAFVKKDGFGDPLIIVEDANLNQIGDSIRFERVFILPWQIEALDSAPCTVLVEVVEDE